MNAADKPQALEQVRRMRGMDRYPKFAGDGPAEMELAEALFGRARDLAHAEKLIDKWLATNTNAPKVVELLELQLSEPEEFELEPAVGPRPRLGVDFIDRGLEYQDPDWQASCESLNLPKTREFYNACWHDPLYFVTNFGGLVVDHWLLSEPEKEKLRLSLYRDLNIPQIDPSTNGAGVLR